MLAFAARKIRDPVVQVIKRGEGSLGKRQWSFGCFELEAQALLALLRMFQEDGRCHFVDYLCERLRTSIRTAKIDTAGKCFAEKLLRDRANGIFATT